MSQDQQRIAAMPRNVFRPLVVSIIALMLASPLAPLAVRADTPVVVITGGATTNEAGSFTVGLSLKTASGCDGELAYGAFELDAVGGPNGVKAVELTFCVSYEDTRADRAAYQVQLRVESFELTPQPLFEGSEVARFQIPNRYLSLTSVGTISGGSADPGVGQLTHQSADETMTFGGDTPLRIASAGGGSGFQSASQEVTLTLSIPAGVHPGDYRSTIHIETIPIL